MDMDTAGETLRVLSVRDEDDSALSCVVRESMPCDSERVSEGERLRFERANVCSSIPRAALSLRRSSASRSSFARPEMEDERSGEG